MKWALVKDEKIVNVQGYLPRKLFGIPEPQLKENGWYKVELDTTQVKEWQTTVETYTYDSVSDSVIETKTITDISLDDWKDKKYSQLSLEAEKYITGVYPLPIQLSAREGWYGEPKSTDILTWVKQHFDIIMKVKSDLYAMTTHEEVNNVYFRKQITDETTLEVNEEKFWGEV